MATNAELESELSALRKQLAAGKPEPKPPLETPPADEHEEEGQIPHNIQTILDEHGIDISSIEAVGKQIADEFAKLQRDYPLAALLAVFALGYIAGRATK